jgi:hypothetical protein
MLKERVLELAKVSPSLFKLISENVNSEYEALERILEEACEDLLWKDKKVHPIPAGKLQFYTIAGTSIYGTKSDVVDEFITHWAYCLPSPSKQAGALK